MPMPWKVDAVEVQRLEAVRLAAKKAISVAEVARRFQISRKTVYKWMQRFHAEGDTGLADRSRRPARSPGRTDDALERRVLELRETHPAWGGRKIQAVLAREGLCPPAPSTITEILRRHGKLGERAGTPRAFQRFERDAPNDLWQMDFKGHFAMRDGGRCHPLTVLDDHSRYAIGLVACGNERSETVRESLVRLFRRSGMPSQMLMDNGSPWGNSPESPWTPLTIWLLKQGVRVSHGRPYHPQTQGKDERFHRTLKAELLTGREFRDLSDCQARFDPWRDVYNYQRPHEALGMQVPAERYRPSSRSYRQQPEPWPKAPDDEARKVQYGGDVAFRGQTWRVSKAFHGETVFLRPTNDDGVWEVWFGPQCLGRLDQRETKDRRVVRTPE
jgi:transposase InsO family protein